MRASLPGVDKVGIIIPGVAPAIVVVGLLLLAGSEGGSGDRPSSVAPAAMPAEYTTMSVTPRPHSAPDVMARASERAAQLAAHFDAPSPFFSEVKPKEADDGEVRAAPRAPTFGAHLTALMNTSRGAIAVIDGRPCRVGDRVDDAATITAIDVDTRTVTATLDGGRTVVLTLARPGASDQR